MHNAYELRTIVLSGFIVNLSHDRVGKVQYSEDEYVAVA